MCKILLETGHKLFDEGKHDEETFTQFSNLMMCVKLFMKSKNFPHELPEWFHSRGPLSSLAPPMFFTNMSEPLGVDMSISL